METTKRYELKLRVLQQFGTQGAFAKAVGLWDQEVSDILNGKRKVSETTVRSWSQVLGIPAQDVGRMFFPGLS